MFLFHKPSQAEIETFVSRQRTEQFSYREVGATAGMLPLRYTIDRNGTKLGQGAETFRVATSALRLWVMFKARMGGRLPANAPIEVGTTVGVLVNHFGFWSLNASRVVYVVKEPRSFGFAYGTLQDHAERAKRDSPSIGLRRTTAFITTCSPFRNPGSGRQSCSHPLVGSFRSGLRWTRWPPCVPVHWALELRRLFANQSEDPGARQCRGCGGSPAVLQDRNREYGEGDLFVGIKVPPLRALARSSRGASASRQGTIEIESSRRAHPGVDDSAPTV
jgi:uncharacterized protein (UPF0548 family)